MKKIMVPVLLGVCFLISVKLLFAIITNQSADMVIGHRYFSQNGANGNDAGKIMLNKPNQVYCESTSGNRLFIVDSSNNRILVYNKPPADYNTEPDAVIGQPDFYSNRPNQGGNPGPNTLNNPKAVYIFGSLLLISDHGNNRVLIYNSIPTGNNASASIVIGQVDMQHGSSNQGGTPAANTLQNPGGICSSGSTLFIADTGNHRVLKYDSIPGYSNFNASAVIGQPNTTSRQPNNGGLSGATLSTPINIWVAGSKLMIADTWNHRILIYNDLSQITTGKSADVVIGQPDMIHNDENQGLSNPNFQTLYFPWSVYSDGSKVFVCDQGNNRILIYNNFPGSSNPTANVVVGQHNETGQEINGGHITSGSDTLNTPIGVCAQGNKMYIADSGNNRVLVFNSIPADCGQGADIVLGQNDMTRNAQNRSETLETTLRGPRYVIRAKEKLIVSDTENNRLLIYNHFPTTNFAKADMVIGQADMKGDEINRGGENPSASTLYRPIGLCLADDQLLVADTYNHRILIYDMSDLQQDMAASLVIGQPNMLTGNPNQGGFVSDKSLRLPYGVCTDGTKLFIADMANNRILIYQHIPKANNAGADLVIGQPDMSSSASNRGGNAGANTLSAPSAIGLQGSRLLVADADNNRVLIFNSIPTAVNAAADIVIGQPNMTSNQINQGGNVEANTLRAPAALYIYNDDLYLSDYYNHRVLMYHHLPAANNASGDIVIGQSYMAGSASNQGSTPARNTLSYPRGLYVDETGLYVADAGNNRILGFLNATPTPTVTPDIAYQNEMKAFNSRFNPETGGKVYIRWHQAETARTTIKIYTLRGDWVKTLVTGESFNAGQLNEAVWNGLNTGGSVVASGIYIVHINAGRYQDWVKVAVIK